MSDAPAPSPQEAVEVLRHLEDVQARTRRAVQAFWFPLVLFGALTLASVPVAFLDDGPAVAVFWAVAGPLGGAAVAWHYRRSERHVGAGRSGGLYVATAIGLLGAAFLLPAVTTGDLQDVVSAFAVAAAYLVFAWLDRSAVLAVLAAMLAAVPLVALAADLSRPGAVTAAITGAVTLAVGVAARHSS